MLTFSTLLVVVHDNIFLGFFWLRTGLAFNEAFARYLSFLCVAARVFFDRFVAHGGGFQELEILGY